MSKKRSLILSLQSLQPDATRYKVFGITLGPPGGEEVLVSIDVDSDLWDGEALTLEGITAVARQIIDAIDTQTKEE